MVDANEGGVAMWMDADAEENSQIASSWRQNNGGVHYEDEIVAVAKYPTC